MEQALSGGGRPLDAPMRAYFEPRFGFDLSEVRIHTDTRAEASAQAVNALAYTAGQDIVFNRGEYAPGTAGGRRLLAHELTHVLQQRRGDGPALRALVQRAPGDPAAASDDPTPGSQWKVKTPGGGNLLLRVVADKPTTLPDGTPNTVGNLASGTTVEVVAKKNEQGFYQVTGEVGLDGGKREKRTGFVHRSYLFPVSAAGSPEGKTPDDPSKADTATPKAPENAAGAEAPAEEEGPTADEQIKEALLKPNPVATVGQTLGDHAEAYKILNGQSMDEMLRILVRLRRSGDFENLNDPTNLVKAVDVDINRIKAALKAVEIRGTPAAEKFATDEAGLFSGLPEDQKKTLLDFVVKKFDFTAESDKELGAEYLKAQGDPARLEALEDELTRRDEKTPEYGVALPKGPPAAGKPGTTSVTPQVALKLLENYSRGEAPFKPELGKGGASWFVTEGNPYVGIDAAKNVPVEVELTKTEGGLVFDEAALLKLHEQAIAETQAEGMVLFKQHLQAKYGLDPAAPLSNRRMKEFTKWHRKYAESRMWDKVGEQVARSPNKTGEVILQNSTYSKAGNGKFAVVSDPAKIQLKGGPGKLIEALESTPAKAEPVVIEAAEAVATKLKWAGKVRTAFRLGGKILIVVAVAMDLWKIYRAEDKKKAVLTTVAGWAGASAAGAAFAAFWTPADTAGPWAWAGHGVGTLVAGGDRLLARVRDHASHLRDRGRGLNGHEAHLERASDRGARRLRRAARAPRVHRGAGAPA
ncbi:MAG: DUF4157 domain-containing protein [Minicystis sp.]